MARVYDIAVAALALDVDRKWLDNLTSQHTIPGTDHFARGVARRLSMRTLVTAALVRDLSRDLGVPVARGVEVALGFVNGEKAAAGTSAEGEAAIRPPDGSAVVRRIGSRITLAIDIAQLEREIEGRLLTAMETVVPRRRGRPPRKERRGTR
jgi:hypothetical protein